MKEIWIIGIGQFGLLAAERLAKKYNNHHFVLVDPDRKNLLQGEGPNRALELMDGVSFLDQRLNLEKAPEWIIPALPIHLAAEWCIVREELNGLKRMAIPSEIDHLAANPVWDPSGNLFVSHANFTCPEDCAEPAKICTVTQKKRKTDMFELLAKIRISKFQPIAVRSYQLCPGVGGYRPRQLFDLLKQVEKIKGNFLLSTACRCHGVITCLGYS
jgi:hypothetical protein